MVNKCCSTGSPKVLSRVRLQAAVSLLQLSTVEVYANALTPKFLRLAVTVQVIYDGLSSQLSLLKPYIVGLLL